MCDAQGIGHQIDTRVERVCRAGLSRFKTKGLGDLRGKFVEIVVNDDLAFQRSRLAPLQPTLDGDQFHHRRTSPRQYDLFPTLGIGDQPGKLSLGGVKVDDFHLFSLANRGCFVHLAAMLK